MLLGWGLFNLVQGIGDHHILTIHHVRENVANQWAYDVSFLVLGALLVLGGWALARSDEDRVARFQAG
jgi:uncharacterized membrane protein